MEEQAYQPAPKEFEELIDDVLNSKWYNRRGRVKALKVLLMSDKGIQVSRDPNENERVFQKLANAMEEHFGSRGSLQVLKYQRNDINNYGWIKVFCADFVKDKPTLQKAVQKIDHELLQQFNVEDDKSAYAVIRKIEGRKVQGLSVSSTDKKGSTLLHKVLEQLNPDMPDDEIRLIFNHLKENGADFNAKDGKGNTPLHIAARRRLVRLNAVEVQRQGQVEVQSIGEVFGGAVKILCEEFGAYPEIANNALETPAPDGNPSEIRAIRTGEYLDEHASSLHAAIEVRDVKTFKRLIEHYRVNAQHNYVRGFQNNHTKFERPISYLQKLISDYENEKRLHSPRQWWRQRKLKKMMALYLNNLAQHITRDLANAVPNDNLRAEITDLSEDNRNIVFRNALIIYAFPAQRQAVRDRYLGVVLPQERAEDNNHINNSNNDVAPAPAVASAFVVLKDPVAELQVAFQSFEVRKQPVADLLKLLEELNSLSPKQIAAVLNAEKSQYYPLSSSIQTACNILRIKLWDYTHIWKVLLKVTEDSDKNPSVEQAVRNNFTTEVVRLIKDRKAKIDHGVNGKMTFTLLKSAAGHHNSVVVELLLDHGAKVTFAEFGTLFMISAGHDDHYLAEGARVNELLQARFKLEKWPAAEIRTVLSDKYGRKDNYFTAYELQALLSGLSRLTVEERDSILNRQIRIGGYSGELQSFRDRIHANCVKEKIVFPDEYSKVQASSSVAPQSAFHAPASPRRSPEVERKPSQQQDGPSEPKGP